MINEFDGKYAFLSNFYESPINFQGEIFPTVEHLFQARKTIDPNAFLEIRLAETPGRAKRLGRRVALRPDWEEIKDDVMMDALRRKFCNPNLFHLLAATGSEELVEGNTWHDNYWGDCHCPRCKNIPGKNALGKMLMKLRDE